MTNFPRGYAYDPDHGDPTPAPMPRRPVPLWRRAINVFGWSILVCGLVASFFGVAGKALLMWLS